MTTARPSTPEFILNVAFTGAVSDKARNPAVPYSVAEILTDAKACALAGAAIGHFHVRDTSGRASNDPRLYADLFAALRQDPLTRDMIICASTSGRHGQTFEQRAAVLALPEAVRPDMASLTLSSLNFAGGPSVSSPDTIRALARAMLDHGIRPELEVFDLGMVTFLRRIIDEGLVTPPFYINVILGCAEPWRNHGKPAAGCHCQPWRHRLSARSGPPARAGRRKRPAHRPGRQYAAPWRTGIGYKHTNGGTSSGIGPTVRAAFGQPNAGQDAAWPQPAERHRWLRSVWSVGQARPGWLWQQPNNCDNGAWTRAWLPINRTTYLNPTSSCCSTAHHRSAKPSGGSSRPEPTAPALQLG
jgi:hypothetical protein